MSLYPPSTPKGYTMPLQYDAPMKHLPAKFFLSDLIDDADMAEALFAHLANTYELDGSLDARLVQLLINNMQKLVANLRTISGAVDKDEVPF